MFHMLVSRSCWHYSIHVVYNPAVNLLVDESEEGRLWIPTNTRARADHSPLLPHSTIPCKKRPPRVSLAHSSTPPFPCSTHLARENFYSPLSTAVTPAGYVHLKTGILRNVLLWNTTVRVQNHYLSSSQGGSWKWNENDKTFNVTIVSDDGKRLGVHKKTNAKYYSRL